MSNTEAYGMLTEAYKAQVKTLTDIFAPSEKEQAMFTKCNARQ